MTLESIEESDDQAIYRVEGEVEDVSGGESPKDFLLDVTYTVTDDTLTQIVDGETMMDNNFPEIELIQAPLSEGNEWTQTKGNAEGKDVTLEIAIDSFEEDGEQKIYTVLYEDTDSDYYEKRKIKEGVGVLSYEYLYIFEEEGNEESMTVGYEINDQATGFDKSQPMNENNN